MAAARARSSKAKIAQRAAERHQVQQQEYEAKTAKRQAGRKPQGKDQVNLTDEES